MRNDSDALFSHFGIRLNCIHDLQLTELAATTRRTCKYLTSLAKCIEYDTNMSLDEHKHALSVKEQGIKLFALEKGGSYEGFNKRPLQPIAQGYCVQDVLHMPKLWNVYRGRMNEFWEVMVKEASDARVAESQSKEYRWSGEHKKFGCWTENGIRKALTRWKKGQRTGLCG